MTQLLPESVHGSGPSTPAPPSETISRDRNVPAGGKPILDQPPLHYQEAACAVLRCVANTAKLLAQRRIHQPAGHLGLRLRFADGTSARVYRETVVAGELPRDPCVLLVAFRLHAVRGFGHSLFRWESLLNTPLFVGFPGFGSKLWLAHDQHGVYRGVYQWDGVERADHYARALWRVLRLGCTPETIHYIVLPGLHRDDVLAAPSLLETVLPGEARAWWRLVGAA
ncbi:MAG TPA: hypothetical protein VFI42_20940 [Thermomicrobiaceae bacterium]|nr:hypothetical protein [Thermomicrobiaceae bacterium]